MPTIKIECPACKGVQSFDDKHAGLISSCKKCGVPILIPTQTPDSINAKTTAQPVRESISQSLLDHEKTPARYSLCPFCEDKIPSNAIVCLNCGRDLRSGIKILVTTPAQKETGPIPSPKRYRTLMVVSALVLFSVLWVFYFTDIDLGNRLGFGKPHDQKSDISHAPTSQSESTYDQPRDRISSERRQITREGESLTAVTSDIQTITTTDGVTYNNCKITLVQPDALTFSHSAGMSRIPFAKLPPYLATRYEYDPQTASEYSRTLTERRERENARLLHANATKPKSVEVQGPCPVCGGQGYRMSGFNQKHIKCLNCGGDGTITRVSSVPPAP